MYRFIAASLICILVLSLPGGCRKASIPQDTLVIGQASEPRSLDPHTATGNSDFRICAQIYDGLVTFGDDDLEIRPSLATDWEISDDGLTYHFELKQDVRFHDGTPFNADAVVFNFNRILDPKHPYHHTGPFPLSFFFEHIENVVAVNEYEIRFELSKPFAPFLSNLAYPTGYIVSPGAVRTHEESFGRNPVGTGPFRFERWDSQRMVKLKRNPDFHGLKPELTDVYFRPLTDDNARLTEILAGGCDIIMEVPPDMIAFFRDHSEMNVVEAIGPHLWFLVLNSRDSIFNDRRARQAINYAIDKENLVKHLLQETATIPNGPIPQAFTWAHDSSLQPYPHNPGKARQLFQKAGYQGETLTLLAPESGSGMLAPLAMASAIQADLNKIEIDVEIESYEWNTYLAKVNSGLEDTADMAEMAWMTNDPDTLPYLALRSDAMPAQEGFNSGYYENKKVDSLLEKARESIDRQERARLYHEVQKIVHEDAPWAFVASWRQNAVVHDRVRQFNLQPSFLFRLETVHKREVDP